MKLDITKGIQKKGAEVAFDLLEPWGEDTWNGDTIAYVRPVSFSGAYMLADETVIVRGIARARIESPCARCLEPAYTDVTAEVDEAFLRDMGEEREPLPGREMRTPADVMEKGDLPAMLIAALVTIVPACLLVLAVLALVGYFFIV